MPVASSPGAWSIDQRLLLFCFLLGQVGGKIIQIGVEALPEEFERDLASDLIPDIAGFDHLLIGLVTIQCLFKPLHILIITLYNTADLLIFSSLQAELPCPVALT